MYGAVEANGAGRAGVLDDAQDDVDALLAPAKPARGGSGGGLLDPPHGRPQPGCWSRATAGAAAALTVALGAALGALLRVNLKGLVAGAGVAESYLLANFLGCWILGWWKRNEYDQVLSRAMRVGFCGTLTTFAGWALLSAEVIVDTAQTPLVRALLWIQFQATCLGVGLLAYGLGYRSGYITFGGGPPVSTGFRNAMWVVFSAFCIVNLVVAAPSAPVLELEVAAILGCFVRWALIHACNEHLHFPAGTFLANALGCVLVGISFTFLNPRYRVPLADGFCGGLSTMSDFVSELYHMHKRHRSDAMVYGAISILLNQVMLSTIMTVYTTHMQHLHNVTLSPTGHP